MKPNNTDTIPRISNVRYFFEGLRVISEGATFEQIRQSLIDMGKQEAERELGVARAGYSVEHRLRLVDSYTYWTNARDVVRELIALDFVKPNTVPSKRFYVEEHRKIAYELTREGRDLVKLRDSDGESRFLDKFFEAMYRKHPHMRIYLSKLSERELHIPIYKIGHRVETEGKVVTDKIITDAGQWLSEKEINGKSMRAYANDLIDYVRRKIGQRGAINNSIVIKAINEAVEKLFIKAYGFDFDSITFDQLTRICTQFWVANYSYQIPSIEGLVVYPTAEIEVQGSSVRIHRHRLAQYLQRILEEIYSQFCAIGKTFVPIHELRAAVCHKLRINDEVFDYALIGIYEGKYPVNYAITLLRDISGSMPPSASPLVINNKRFYSLTLTTIGG